MDSPAIARRGRSRIGTWCAALAVTVAAGLLVVPAAFALGHYTRHNLVSDQAGKADIRDKDLVNACWTIDGKITQDWSKPENPHGKVEKVTDWAKCNQLFPIHSDARIAAGAPMTDDVLKCQLKPIDAKDYKAPPTADQMNQLKAVFADGVCDWSKPGVGQDAKLATWAIYSDAGKWSQLATK